MSIISKSVKNAWFLTGFFILIFLLSGCGSQKVDPIALSGQTMGTTYHITIANIQTDATGEALKKEIDQLLVGVNQSFSTYIESSEVSQLNKYKGTDGQLKSAPFIEVLTEALRISKLTDGAYDITVGPLVNLWGFGPTFKEDNPPSADDIARAMSSVDYKNISLEQETRLVKKLKPEMYIDFSSIAKGYGVDKVANLIESKGFTDYMVEIGGEMRLRGNNPNGTKWRIAVEKPESSKRAVQRVINLSDIAMATSGDYRNFFIKDGVQFSHTIDPTTGSPVQHNVASVTVLAPSSMTADALATAFMVLGEEKGYDLAVENKLAVLFLLNKGGSLTELMTPSFQKLIERPSP
ncbi:MAG: FAD:protein FMN transferase [Cycloclasticus sp.]